MRHLATVPAAQVLVTLIGFTYAVLGVIWFLLLAAGEGIHSASAKKDSGDARRPRLRLAENLGDLP